MEVWKDVPNYMGLYEASNKGRVRSKEGKVTYTERHGIRVWKSRVLKTKSQYTRDARVDLWKGGKPRTWLVQRIVAKTFIPNTEEKPCINHKDGNPRNNHVTNLEWVTHKENQNHAFDNGLVGTNTEIKVTDKQTGESKVFRSMAKASEYIGRNKGYISAVLSRGQNEASGYRFELAES